MDSSPNLRLCKSNSTPPGAIPDPLRLLEESAKKLSIRVDYSPLSLSHFREEINRWPGSKKRLINGEIIERKITTNSPRKRNGRSRYFRLQDSYLTYKGDESLSQNSPLPMISILPNFLQLPRAERAGRRLLSFLLLWEEEACTLVLRYRWDPKSQDDFVSRSKGEYIRICRILLKQIRFKELKNKEREKIRSRIKLESDGMIY